MGDKINIVDQCTFEQLKLQHHTGSTKIKNAKYKKKNPRGTTFHLNAFIKPQIKISKAKQSKYKKYCNVEKYGRRRKGHMKKHLTRIKKYILRHRKSKISVLSTVAETVETTNTERCIDTEIVQLPNNFQSLTIKPSIHSRTFRSYCNNLTTDGLKTATDSLLRQLHGFQSRAFQRNPIKARARRRFVLGFRETNNLLSINKVKLLILAPDCEDVPGTGGINELIENLKKKCCDLQVPYLFALKRREIRYALHHQNLVSCVAILNMEGCEEMVKLLLEELQQAKLKYEEIM